nr:MAG TPA: hypothetical protein [Caudoviricetes sp.]
MSISPSARLVGFSDSLTIKIFKGGTYYEYKI